MGQWRLVSLLRENLHRRDYVDRQMIFERFRRTDIPDAFESLSAYEDLVLSKTPTDHLFARVAKLANTLDLGFRNHRFQNIALCFKKQRFYEGNHAFSAKSV